MLGYSFETIYKKGKEIMVVDALSREDEDVESLLYALSIIQLHWIVEVMEEWKNDLSMWMLIQKLQKDHNLSDSFTWKNDSI